MKFYASGKLLLFGEYTVLKGAICLGIPLRFGQTLEVSATDSYDIRWQSYEDARLWFEANYSEDLNCLSATDNGVAGKLQNILALLKSASPQLFKHGLAFTSRTDFSPEWGFGTSSTLISLLAQWSGVNPQELLAGSFGGSGFDVACATAHTPILYQRQPYRVQRVKLSDNVTSRLLFVYSGKKQATASEVRKFETQHTLPADLKLMNDMVNRAVACTGIASFEDEMNASEALLSRLLGRKPIGQEKFSDYPYAIKSLGAWGGDFIMASFRDESQARKYFTDRGYATHFLYSELIKK